MAAFKALVQRCLMLFHKFSQSFDKLTKISVFIIKKLIVFDNPLQLCNVFGG
jgi:hypothetical protein